MPDGASYDESFYSAVAQVIPFLMGLLFLENRMLRPSTLLTAFSFYVPLVVMAVAEANALSVLYRQEAPESIQRNVVLSGLLLSIGSLVLTPIVRDLFDWMGNDQERRKVLEKASLLAGPLAVGGVIILFVGDPLVTLSWLVVILLPLSIAASHWTRRGYWKKLAAERERQSREESKDQDDERGS